MSVAGSPPGSGGWLTQMADVLRAAGLPVIEHPGWQTRSNSTGALRAMLGIIVHHSASGTGWTAQREADFLWLQHDTRPVGNLLLDRTGAWWVGCAGSANTAGRGGPWTTSLGTVPLDGGNSRTLNIEAANNGVGEPWSPAMQDSYTAGVAALCAALGMDPLRDVAAHFEWTTRKIDPAGPSRWTRPGDQWMRWDMHRFRQEVTDRQETDMPLTDDDINRIAEAVWSRATLNPTDGSTTRTDSLLAFGFQASSNAEWWSRQAADAANRTTTPPTPTTALPSAAAPTP